MLESSMEDLILKQYDSRPFLALIFSFCLSSSSLNFSDSSTILSISSFDNLPLSFVMVIFSVLPPAFSTAETFSIPLASTSKVTSICGVPRGAGGIPVRLNSPRRWFGWLVIGVCCKCLGLLSWNGCVSFNQSRHYSSG